MGSRKNVFLVLPCLLLLLKTKNSSKSQNWRNSHYIVKGKFTKYSRTLQSPIIGNLLKFLLYKTIANISFQNRFKFAPIPLHRIKSKYLRFTQDQTPICKIFTQDQIQISYIYVLGINRNDVGGSYQTTITEIHKALRTLQAFKPTSRPNFCNFINYLYVLRINTNIRHYKKNTRLLKGWILFTRKLVYPLQSLTNLHMWVQILKLKIRNVV